MAITKLNYVPGAFEAVTAETLDDTPVLNTWYSFTIDGWKHALADVDLIQGGSSIPSAAFEISLDTEYTARETTESGKSIYGAWRIVNATYAGITTSITGYNFGSYVDNEGVNSKIDALETLIPADASELDYDNSTSGLSADNVQDAIDEVVGMAAPPPFCRIAEISRASSTSLTVDAGVSVVINGALLQSASAATVTRNRATASEFEFLYVYDNSGTLAFEMDYTEPTFDTARSYYTKTGDTTRRWLGLAVPKDGSGNFYNFKAISNGANSLELLFIVTNNNGFVIRNAAMTINTLYEIDCSDYIYENGRTNISSLKATKIISNPSTQITLYTNATNSTSAQRVDAAAGYDLLLYTHDIAIDSDTYYIYSTRTISSAGEYISGGKFWM
jgi:hypothetical protein